MLSSLSSMTPDPTPRRCICSLCLEAFVRAARTIAAPSASASSAMTFSSILANAAMLLSVLLRRPLSMPPSCSLTIFVASADLARACTASRHGSVSPIRRCISH